MRSKRPAPSASQAPPKDWVSLKDLLATTDASERNLLQWRGQGLIPKPEQIALGRGKGSASYYPPDTVAMVRRLYELQRQTRDVDAWIWGLWIDPQNFPVVYGREKPCLDIRAWALRRLGPALKGLETRQENHDLEKLIATAKTGRDHPFRAIRGRVRDRGALNQLSQWAAAIVADLNQPMSLYDPQSEVFGTLLKAAGLPDNQPPPDKKLGVELMSIGYLCEVLESASVEELDQARRDWRTIAGLAKAAEAIDWGAVTPLIEPTVRSMTGGTPEPPSIRARRAQRRAQRQRPSRPPAIIDLLLSYWSNLDCRAVLLPGLISIRRSLEHSSILDKLLGECFAFAELALSLLPRKSEAAL